MNPLLKQLGTLDFEFLLEALRRDLRNTLDKVQTEPEWTELHCLNARRSIRILEAINPKRPRAASFEQELHRLRDLEKMAA